MPSIKTKLNIAMNGLSGHRIGGIPGSMLIQS
jgi:hypothetical protein